MNQEHRERPDNWQAIREPTYTPVGVANRYLEATTSKEEQSYYDALAPFDERMQLAGEPPIAAYFDQLPAETVVKLPQSGRRRLYRVAAAVGVLLLAYSTHQAYARHQLRVAIEQTREGVTEELGDLGRFRFGDMIPPEQTEATARAKKLVAEFYKRYPRHSLSENDRNLMDQTEAFLLYAEGKPAEAIAMIPNAAEGEIEANRQRVLAVAYQQLGEWEEAGNAWKFLYDSKEMEPEERTIMLRSYVSCLVSAKQYEEASSWNEQVIAEAEKEVSDAAPMSTERAFAYDRLAKDYCTRALIIKNTTGDLVAENEALNQALKTIGKGMRITTKQVDDSVDLNAEVFHNARTNAFLIKTYMFVLQTLTKRYQEVSETQIAHYEGLMQQVVDSAEQGRSWDALYVLRSHYMWQVDYQEARGNDERAVEYGIKFVLVEKELWEKLGRRSKPLSLQSVLTAFKVAVRLEDFESMIQLLEFVVENSDRDTINAMHRPTKLDHFASLLNNLAYSYAMRVDSNREELNRALDYVRQAIAIEPDSVDFQETLQRVRERLKDQRAEVVQP